jgi:hypothetical protein
MDERRLCGNNSSGERGGSSVGYNCHHRLVEEEEKGTATPSAAASATTEAPSSTYSIRGIHRNKHTIRFLFRSLSFLVLISGYSLRNYYYGGGADSNIREDSVDGGVDGQSLRRRVLLSASSSIIDATNQEGELLLIITVMCFAINNIGEKERDGGGQREGPLHNIWA